MTEVTVEFRLGQLDAGLKALISEVKGMRDDMRLLGREFNESLEQHDGRDDERFTSHGRRLDTLERKQAVAEDHGKNDGIAAEHHHDRRNLIHSAMIGAIAALGSGLLIVAGTHWLH